MLEIMHETMRILINLSSLAIIYDWKIYWHMY